MCPTQDTGKRDNRIHRKNKDEKNYCRGEIN